MMFCKVRMLFKVRVVRVGIEILTRILPAQRLAEGVGAEGESGARSSERGAAAIVARARAAAEIEGVVAGAFKFRRHARIELDAKAARAKLQIGGCPAIVLGTRIVLGGFPAIVLGPAE